MSFENDRRREAATRLVIPLPVRLECDNGTSVHLCEETLLQDISPQGASVFSTLPVEPGQILRLSSKSQDTPITACVRNRTISAAGQTRLHLQFLDRTWQEKIV